MTNKEAKQWAEILNAYAEGKTIERLFPCSTGSACWNIVTTIDFNQIVDYYRIKPEPVKKRMTYQKLSDWLRDHPEEHREWKRSGSCFVYAVYTYKEDDLNEEVPDDILIRRNHGKWEEPVIEVEE